eukprot:767058-Hanusia_phi.AAC.3
MPGSLPPLFVSRCAPTHEAKSHDAPRRQGGCRLTCSLVTSSQPANVFLGEGGNLKLGDLGLGRLFSSRTLECTTVPFLLVLSCVSDCHRGMAGGGNSLLHGPRGHARIALLLSGKCLWSWKRGTRRGRRQKRRLILVPGRHLASPFWEKNVNLYALRMKICKGELPDSNISPHCTQACMLLWMRSMARQFKDLSAPWRSEGGAGQAGVLGQRSGATSGAARTYAAYMNVSRFTHGSRLNSPILSLLCDDRDQVPRPVPLRQTRSRHRGVAGPGVLLRPQLAIAFRLRLRHLPPPYCATAASSLTQRNDPSHRIAGLSSPLAMKSS